MASLQMEHDGLNRRGYDDRGFGSEGLEWTGSDDEQDRETSKERDGLPDVEDVQPRMARTKPFPGIIFKGA